MCLFLLDVITVILFCFHMCVSACSMYVIFMCFYPLLDVFVCISMAVPPWQCHHRSPIVALPWQCHSSATPVPWQCHGIAMSIWGIDQPIWGINAGMLRPLLIIVFLKTLDSVNCETYGFAYFENNVQSN